MSDTLVASAAGSGRLTGLRLGGISPTGGPSGVICAYVSGLISRFTSGVIVEGLHFQVTGQLPAKGTAQLPPEA